ncbi:hypothetical protein ABMA28_001815 [Loxostege sticticalis]|uniref:Reverse transcriptase domain-containing protein n=1 Tax=Loxostege sticticalis TaxID=481309 RepID=A0ABD0T735_LOXSC
MVLLSRLKLNCDLYILTETWNAVHTNLPIMNNYNRFSTTNNHNRSDGLVIYTKTGLTTIVKEVILKDASCLTIKINSNTIVIAIYRSPSIKNIDPFLNSLDKLLKKHKFYSTIILMGDINIDIKPNNQKPDSDKYLNFLAMHGLLAGHTFPTRFGSCLDHFMVKTNNKSVTLVLRAPLTDHSAVISCLDIVTQDSQKSRTFVMNKVNYPDLLSDLEMYSFHDILASNDANWAAERFVGVLTNILDKHTSTTLVPRRTRCLKPWITPGLVRCMRNRDKMHLRCKLDPNNEIINITYRRYKNFCNDLLKRLKRNYERNELNKCSNNLKKTWETVKSIVYTSKQTTIPTELLKIGATPKNSVEMVNEFFAELGKRYSDKIPNCNADLSNKIDHKSPAKSFVMLETDNEEIETVIMGLKNDSAMGWDGISNKLLKNCRHILIPIITHITNLSFTTGNFPDIFKISIIHPIHKTGAKDNIDNYRPISVLPALSKILEKVMNRRLLSFLENEHLISDNQYGFRAGKSTSDAVSGISEYIAQNLDCQNKSIGMFLDKHKSRNK